MATYVYGYNDKPRYTLWEDLVHASQKISDQQPLGDPLDWF